jgi:hypothetical protein
MSRTKQGNKRIFKREEIKYPLMQFGYGQQAKGTTAQLKNDMENYFDGAYNIFIMAVERVIPGFSTLMQYVNSLWDDRTEIKFTMPDGFTVLTKTVRSDWEEFELFDSIKVKAKISGVDNVEQTLILYVNFIHAIDGYIAREMVKRCDFQVLTIHDAFRCHPNNAHKMKKIYNEILADVMEMNLLPKFIKEITGNDVDPIEGDLTREDIIKARYSLS